MKYVKLTAKPDTWFIEGTEVYDYDSDENNMTRVTLEHWNECNKPDDPYNLVAICVSGRRLSELGNEVELFGEGERWDGEYCTCDEFDVEIVDEPR